ncbi:AAA family ATPase [Enterobacter sp. Y17]|uniref:AAA family ATPase n=1 Tax=Enterobacter sp. Y17 TaxID=2720028 RepID=UPI001C8B3CD0|nr:AAA family ATPase [Enterobacter sp. Y17]MBX8837529.1 AAA family ATPase [Enterobacter sp. Y17]
MDEYISEFLYNYYDEDNNYRKLLLWLILDRNNNASKITARLKYAQEYKNIYNNTSYYRSLLKYKKFYESRNLNVQGRRVSNRKIKYLQVSNFRGFGQLSDEDMGVRFNFNISNNIFFAPNGGGKSSLCEALEFQTTGDIKEAGRRKTALKNYIKRNGKPSITLHDYNNKPILPTSDCKFNFIDRNRLQEFSLLGSSDTKFQERDVLAALVGLEDYDTFLSTLVAPKSFNAQSFVSVDYSSKLTSLNLDLQRYRKASKDNYDDLQEIKLKILNELGINYEKLCERYRDDVARTKFPHIKRYHAILTEKKSQLKKGISSIEIPLEKSTKILLSLIKVIERKERIEAGLEEIAFNEKTIELHRISKLLLEEEAHDACPLCNTPIEKVSINPLQHSIDILVSFTNVTSLQKRLKKHNSYIVKLTNVILETLRSFLISPINTLVDCDFVTLSDISNNLAQMNDDGLKKNLRYLHESLINCTSIASYNEKTIQHNLIVSDITESLKKIDTKINKISNSIANITNYIAIYKSKIQNKAEKHKAFDTLLNQIQSTSVKLLEENARNNFFRGLNVEYAEFYRQAYEYKRNKEAQILSGIEGSIVDYYNEINKHDDDSEKLDGISFVFESSQQSYRVQLNIQNEQVDAFVRLSEGHLKSLGLSILLALAKKKNSQFIVFDDVVNAIDTEHRSNIINTFLTDPYIKKTQKIITTHDKLFWELYSNRQRSLGNGEFKSFVLNCYPHGIHYEEKDISFEGKITESLECYDIRQALIYCRIWFESLASQHCVDSGLSVTASFTSRDFQKPNMIKISLEKMYAVLIESLGARLENVNYIKSNFLSWASQNQEHHAFSEHNYNIVHSKTSQEIQMIFDSIRRFEIQLSPQKKLASLVATLSALETKISSCDNKIQRATQATPADVMRQWNNERLKYLREKSKIEELKDYCENCLL